MNYSKHKAQQEKPGSTTNYPDDQEGPFLRPIRLRRSAENVMATYRFTKAFRKLDRALGALMAKHLRQYKMLMNELRRNK